MNYFPDTLTRQTIRVWPNLGSVVFAGTIGMIARTPRLTSTTKCVCAVMLTEKEGVLTQVRAQLVLQERASAAEPSAAGARQRQEC